MPSLLPRSARQCADNALTLLYACDKIAADKELLAHENNGLRKAVTREKQKRKRGKALKCLDEGETGGKAQFLSPAKIERIRMRNAEAKQAERKRKADLELQKLERVAAKKRKPKKPNRKKKRGSQRVRSSAQRRSTRNASELQHVS